MTGVSAPVAPFRPESVEVETLVKRCAANGDWHVVTLLDKRNDGELTLYLVGSGALTLALTVAQFAGLGIEPIQTHSGAPVTGPVQ